MESHMTTSQLSSNISLVIKQLVTDGMKIYAYHWDPPELYIYIGEDEPLHIRISPGVLERANDVIFLKKWIWMVLDEMKLECLS